jgi:hypothetical protein
LGVLGIVLDEDALLMEVVVDAAGMIEQPRFTAQPEAIEAG